MVCGDENGCIWAWDLVDVSIIIIQEALLSDHTQAAIFQPNPPPQVHSKVITWTEHHPTQPDEMITASADGTVNVWRNG